MTIGGLRLSVAAARPVTSEVEKISLNKARINLFWHVDIQANCAVCVPPPIFNI
jgi:hypothetical protein